jgi:hypothetical protein
MSIRKEYYWWTAYYIAQPPIWTEIKIRLRDFGDEDIVMFWRKQKTCLRSGATREVLKHFMFRLTISKMICCLGNP